MMPQLFEDAAQHIKKAERIADIGPGIRPQPFYTAKEHICVEPHGEYADWLEAQGYPVVRKTAREALREMDRVGVIFMLDVIEHMDKEEGVECLRLSLEKADQVVVFTPLGFHEQSYKDGDRDAWGMNGTHWQTHRSGWTPDDFPGARIFVNPVFHHGAYGAFFALLGS